MEATQSDGRRALLDSLLNKVDADHYPSPTMLDLIESLLTDDDVDDYVRTLIRRIDDDSYPSLPLIRRVQRLI